MSTPAHAWLTYRNVLPQFFGGTQFVYAARSFFGVKGVKFDLLTNSRRLLHGDTLHGLESLDPDLAGQPLSYYHETGPVGDVMRLTVAERFAAEDPYVKNGLVKNWRVRPWTTVVGETASTPVR